MKKTNNILIILGVAMLLAIIGTTAFELICYIFGLTQTWLFCFLIVTFLAIFLAVVQITSKQ